MIKIYKKKGFTLIEVMIALSIVALSLTAAMMASTENTRRLLHVEKKTVAHWIAENEINRSMTGEKGYFLSQGLREGRVNMAGVFWRFEEKIQFLPNKALEIKVSVRQENDNSPTDTMVAYGNFHER